MSNKSGYSYIVFSNAQDLDRFIQNQGYSICTQWKRYGAGILGNSISPAKDLGERTVVIRKKTGHGKTAHTLIGISSAVEIEDTIHFYNPLARKASQITKQGKTLNSKISADFKTAKIDSSLSGAFRHAIRTKNGAWAASSNPDQVTPH